MAIASCWLYGMLLFVAVVIVDVGIVKPDEIVASLENFLSLLSSS